eukprot:CAMPEP_0197832548 /NCGR_PEP_ID=MMETSP1437-20131217/15266_1 /TAXON_ID=49252 ORGANISM="Eucampia antarctica, Strain CCMP1452" /NCGR_SAMPLE_ID=MMETSP1437 /ASSEMBLY_ACC=CAM_ASM_001096 /LENGTH=196 /DNA_ID=CAMNT_0043435979 /DNA_START=56 /DNA_END=646 /DNA_ORIENTATION=+
MIKKQTVYAWLATLLLCNISSFSDAFSFSSSRSTDMTMKLGDATSRRTFFVSSAAAALSTVPLVAKAAGPEIFTTQNGVKYATIKQPSAKAAIPRQGDLVVVEYTGYLSNGQIFDATHAEGKKKELLFKIGSAAVIPGLNEVISEMAVGQKVQAIVPPQLAFGDEGVCLENGECLIKPGATLVYDVFLRKTSIPPP